MTYSFLLNGINGANFANKPARPATRGAVRLPRAVSNLVLPGTACSSVRTASLPLSFLS